MAGDLKVSILELKGIHEYIPGKYDCREKEDGNPRKNTVVYLSEGKIDVVTDASRQADWGRPG